MACRESLPQAALTRFSRDAQGNWQADPARRLGGRGAWVCGKDECRIERRLARFFRSQAGAVAEQLELERIGAGQPGRRINV